MVTVSPVVRTAETVTAVRVATLPVMVDWLERFVLTPTTPAPSVTVMTGAVAAVLVDPE